MNCEQVEEVLGAYAVEALDAPDMAGMREHLAGCRKHDVALADLEGVVSSLPVSVEERAPAPELRTRLLRAFDDEVALLGSTVPPAAPVREERKVVPFVRRPAFAWLAAAALFIAVVALTTWNVVLQTDGGGGWTVSTNVSGPGVDGHFYYLDRQHLALISMEQMPPAGEGSVYQAWGIYDGQAVSLGLLPNDDTFALDADLEGASTFAITIEPAGGSEAPSSDPVATADIS